jgi:hypothetical protein
MNRSSFLRAMSLAAFSLLTCSGAATAAEKSANTCYELRTYFAAEGKLDALHARFRDHTMKLFEKHGMTNVGYWVPLQNTDNQLIYLLSYPDKTARETSWKAFQEDPEWQTAKTASEANGPLVAKIENRFLTPTDFSTVTLTENEAPHTFELRTYTTGPENLPHLLKRFRDHTLRLFSKHGMEHFHYFTPLTGQTGADHTLIYFLAHASPEAQAASFQAFRDDPEWIAAKEASEKLAGGSLTVPDGVHSKMLIATDYSPVK